YPGLVVFSIISTANHFILDAVGGAATLLLAVTLVVSVTFVLRRRPLPLHHAPSAPAPLVPQYATAVDSRAAASRPFVGRFRPLVERWRSGRSEVRSVTVVTALSLRLQEFKAGYTDGARRLASKFVTLLVRSPVTPNQLTALGFSLNVVAAVLLW